MAALLISPPFLTPPSSTLPKRPSPSTLVPTIKSPHETLHGLAQAGKPALPLDEEDLIAITSYTDGSAKLTV